MTIFQNITYSEPYLCETYIDFQFLLFTIPFIILSIRDKYNIWTLKDDNEYLLIFKQKYVSVSNINERLLAKSRSLKKDIIKYLQDIDNRDNRIKTLEEKIKILQRENNTILPLKEPEFGNGILRSRENGVFYHGVCNEETQKWNDNNKCSRYIYEYKIINKNRRNLDKYKTYNIDEFCNNCLLVEEKNKFKIFECQGHEY